MHVCILNSIHPANDTRVLRISKTLVDAGHKVSLISPNIASVDEDRLELIQIKEVRDAIRADNGFLKNILVIFSRIKVVFSLFLAGWRLNADVYHCNELDSWMVGLILKLLLRKKVIFDAHEYYPSDRVVGSISPKWLRLFVERTSVMFFQLCSRVSDAGIFVNKSLLNFYDFKCKKIVLRSFVRICEGENSSRSEKLYQRYKGKNILIHVGQIRDMYGADVLLNMLVELKDMSDFICVSIGGSEKPKKVQRFVNEHNLHEKFEVIETIPFGEVKNYLSISDIGLVLVQAWNKSFIHSLPRKFLEYIAFGLPIIASDFPEMRKLIQKFDMGILVNQENFKEVANAVASLVESNELHSYYSNNSRRAFQEELNWDKESQKLINLYAEIKREN